MTNKVEDFYSLALTLTVLHICLIAVSEKYTYAQSQHVVDPQAASHPTLTPVCLLFHGTPAPALFRG